MKSKEVLSAMTPGTWTADGCQVHANGVYLLAAQSGAPLSQNKANAAAIVSAVNATYGSGIDPLAVKDLLDVLVALMPNDSVYDLPKGSNLQLTIPVEIFASAKAAISKATLKP